MVDEAPEIYREFVGGVLRTDSGVLAISMNDEKITGYNLGLIKDEIPVFDLKQYGFMADMYVTPECRGRGISTMLKDEVLSWFREKKLECAVIEVFPTNDRTRSLYGKWGFMENRVSLRMKL